MAQNCIGTLFFVTVTSTSITISTKKVFNSEWACPIVSVLKSDGNVRICGDYSLTLNKVMKTVQYPLPSIENVLGIVGDAKVFSKIDLESAYLQLPLDENSKAYTTINTPEGLYH